MGLFKDEEGKYLLFKPLNWGSDEYNKGKEGDGWDLSKGIAKYFIGFVGSVAILFLYLVIISLLIWGGFYLASLINPFYVNPEYARLRWQGNPYFDFPIIRPEGF